MSLDFSKRNYNVGAPAAGVKESRAKESALSMLLEKSRNDLTVPDDSPFGSGSSSSGPRDDSLVSPSSSIESPQMPKSPLQKDFPHHPRTASSSYRKNAPVQSSLQQQRDRARTGESSNTPVGSFGAGYGHLFGAGEIGNVSSPRHYSIPILREQFDPSSVEERFIVNIPHKNSVSPQDSKTSSSLSRSLSKVSLSRTSSRTSTASSFSLRRFVDKPWKNDEPTSPSSVVGSPVSFELPSSRRNSAVPDDASFPPSSASVGRVSTLSKTYGRLGKTLGEGAGGHVKIVKSNTDNQLFAVKEFRARHANETQRQYNKKVGAEYCLGLTLKHVNIVNTIDIIYEPTKVYQVMEYGAYDLFALVMSGKMSREEIFCDFRQFMNGVKYLHESGLAHRDLKLDNCVVTEKGIVKIIDFGSSVVFKYPESDKVYDCDGVVGSDPYLAPEAAGKDRYFPAPTDIWSSGIMLACMLMRKFPWKAPKLSDSTFKMFVQVESNGEMLGMQKLLAALPTETHSILTGMLELNPEKRFTIQQCWQDELLRDHKFCTLDANGNLVKQGDHTHTTVSFEEAHIAMLEKKNRKAKRGEKMW